MLNIVRDINLNLIELNFEENFKNIQIDRILESSSAFYDRELIPFDCFDRVKASGHSI